MHSTVIAALSASGDHPLMSSFPQGAVFAYDLDLRYLAAGGLGLADVGLSRAMLEGRTIHEVFPPETAAAIEPLYRAALQGESTMMDVPYEGRIYLQRLSPVRDADGSIVAGIGFTQDVSDSRAIEHALRAEEQRNRLTFVHAPVGKAIVELDGRWRQVNAAVVELTGYSEAELLGMTFQDITHPEDLELDLAELARLVAGEISSYRIEKRYITAAGRIVHVLLAVALVRDDEGVPLYFIAQIQDITELTNQRQALKDLTSMLAHDLRSATSVISGYTEVLRESWSELSDETRTEHLALIATVSRSMQTLLDNSLTASTLDAGQLESHPARVRVDEIAREALQTIGLVEADLQELHLAEAFVDPTHLRQVLVNLLSNAQKYGRGHVAVGTLAVGDQVGVRILDDGPGVEPEFVPHLFDRFTRSPGARTSDQRGTGLGLAIVADLVRLNGGSIGYVTAPSGGAQFTVLLPVAR